RNIFLCRIIVYARSQQLPDTLRCNRGHQSAQLVVETVAYICKPKGIGKRCCRITGIIARWQREIRAAAECVYLSGEQIGYFSRPRAELHVAGLDHRETPVSTVGDILGDGMVVSLH